MDKEGRPPGLLGLWPSRAVTFIDNHDTGSTQARKTLRDERRWARSHNHDNNRLHSGEGRREKREEREIHRKTAAVTFIDNHDTGSTRVRERRQAREDRRETRGEKR